MIQKRKWAIAGLGIIAFAGTLVSFTNGNDNGKMKRYQIIHSTNGETIHYDTVIPMNSSYSVEDFLADKGIKSDNVEIIALPSVKNGAIYINEEGNHTMISGIEEKMTWSTDANAGEEVKIICEVGEDGKMVTRKLINGEEVEMTEAELESIKVHSDGEGKQVVINVESGEMNEADLEKLMKELKIELKDLDVNIDELTKEIEISVEKTIESNEAGEQTVIIRKQINGSEEDKGDKKGEQVFIMDGNENINWQSEDGQMHIEMITTDSDTEHTLVLVTENYDPSESNTPETNVRMQLSENRVSVYPNPSSGMVTVHLNQTEKLKTRIEISDAQGKVVFKDNLGNFSGEYTKELDLKKHGAGTYIIQIEQGNQVSSEKIVIQ